MASANKESLISCVSEAVGTALGVLDLARSSELNWHQMKAQIAKHLTSLYIINHDSEYQHTNKDKGRAHYHLKT